MLALTLIRLLRDALLLVAAIGFLLTWVAIPSPIGSLFVLASWSEESENCQFIILLTASLSAIAGWFIVQRKEKVVARMHLTRR